MKIDKAGELGFCYGVKRAINILEKVAKERGGVETLGAVVHNQQVLQRLASLGVRVVNTLDDIQGDTVIISTHGVEQKVEKELQNRHVNVIDTTCPFVRRAQNAAQKLAKSGFFVIIYGHSNHPEVKGILGWANNRGVAALDEKFIVGINHLPNRLGILSQTTQVPDHFIQFSKKLIDSAFTKNTELRIIDTICHDIRERQRAALELANKVELMLVIGDHTSANTNRLAELCSTITTTHLVGTVEEIQSLWLQDKTHIGITAGASTPKQTINEILTSLKTLART